MDWHNQPQGTMLTSANVKDGVHPRPRMSFQFPLTSQLREEFKADAGGNVSVTLLPAWLLTGGELPLGHGMKRNPKGTLGSALDDRRLARF